MYKIFHKTLWVAGFKATIFAAGALLALIGCSSYHNDYGAPRASKSGSVQGLWRATCNTAEGTTSKQAELVFLANGTMQSRDVFFTDSNCQDLDAQKTELARRTDENPMVKYTVVTRDPYARGTLVMNAETDSVMTYSYAILKSSSGLQLMLKPEQSSEPVQYYLRVGSSN